MEHSTENWEKSQRLQLKVVVLSEVPCEFPPCFCSQPCQYKAIQCNTLCGPGEKFAWVKYELHPGNKISEYLLPCNICLFERTPLSCYIPCFIPDSFELNQDTFSFEREKNTRNEMWQLARTIACMYNVGGLCGSASRGWEHLACSVWGNHAEIPNRQLPWAYTAWALGCSLPCSYEHFWPPFTKLPIPGALAGGEQHAAALWHSGAAHFLHYLNKILFTPCSATPWCGLSMCIRQRAFPWAKEIINF